MKKSLKEKLPEVSSLNHQLEEIFSGELSSFLSATQNSRDKVKASFLFVLLSISFLLALMVFLYLFDARYNSSWLNKFVLALVIGWATILLVSGRSWFFSSKLLAREANMALAPIFGTLFNRSFLYTQNDGDSSAVKKALEESSLITEKNISIVTDDSYKSYEEDREVHFHELVVTSLKDQENAKPTKLFKGIFMVANLPKTHHAETYVTTQNDRRGFAGRDFWSDILKIGEVKETVLEWNDFEDKLHVATNNPSATREVLTPDFMKDVYDWWSEHKTSIRISFKGNKLYLLIPEASISIAAVTTSKRLPLIKRHAMSLARPMWRGLVLAEDASK